MTHRYRPETDTLILRLDRWASILRNDPPGALTDDEVVDLSTLLTTAANALGATTPRTVIYEYDAETRTVYPLRNTDRQRGDLLVLQHNGEMYWRIHGGDRHHLWLATGVEEGRPPTGWTKGPPPT